MKRLLVLLLALFALLAPVANAETVLPADALGDGWNITESGPPENSLSQWDVKTVYADASGNTVTIWTIDLGGNLDTISTQWPAARLFFAATAERSAVVPDPLTDGIGRQDRDLPNAATDGLRTEGASRATNATAGIGLYGSAGERLAIVVLVEGTVNDMTGITATDYVAGLYFAALAD